MKKFLLLFLSLVLCFSFATPAFALELDRVAEEIPAVNYEENIDIPAVDVPYHEEQSSEVFENDSAVVESVVSDEIIEDEINPELGIEDGTLIGVSVLSVAPITPEDTTGLKSVLLQFIGDYDPIVVEYEYRNNNNTGYSYLREVLPDYVWFGSLLVLILMIYCLFRLGGAIFG